MYGEDLCIGVPATYNIASGLGAQARLYQGPRMQVSLFEPPQVTVMFQCHPGRENHQVSYLFHQARNDYSSQTKINPISTNAQDASSKKEESITLPFTLSKSK